jgi:hypothetical protein
MRALLSFLFLALFAGCSVKLTDSELTSFFDGQKGRVLTESMVEGFIATKVENSLIEYVPAEIPKSGWAVVWRVDTTRLDQLNAGSSEKLVGRIVSWRIIGDRSKVRIPIVAPL